MESVDIFPTLCDLADLPQPEFSNGVSLVPILRRPDAPGHSSISYSGARTIRTDSHRLVEHPDGYVELYDHKSPEAETRNVSTDNPRIVRQMLSVLNRRLPSTPSN